MAAPGDDPDREKCLRVLAYVKSELADGCSAAAGMALITGIARIVIWQVAESDRSEYIRLVETVADRLRNVPPWAPKADAPTGRLEH